LITFSHCRGGVCGQRGQQYLQYQLAALEKSHLERALHSLKILINIITKKENLFQFTNDAPVFVLVAVDLFFLFSLLSVMA
jgi:hypothetical protein